VGSTTAWLAGVASPSGAGAGLGPQPGSARQDRPPGCTALPPWQPLAREVSELQQVLRRRDDVTDWLQRERRRSEALELRPDASPTLRASVERLLQTVADDLADLEQAIADQVQQQSRLQVAQERLRTVPGVGARVVLPLLLACAR
jgi:hypothetical protein